MKIDLHIHTMVSSPCSVIDPNECIEQARSLGLDAICVTEHDTHEGGRVVRDIGRAKGFRVFVGMEVMSREGHLLVYGFDSDIRGVQPADAIIEMVTAAGGIVVPAHPYRYSFGWYTGALNTPLEDTIFPKKFKVIEMYNGLTSAEGNRSAKALCERFGLHGIGGSDAHSLEQIGECHTEFDTDVEDERHLAELIRTGQCKAFIKTPL